MVSRCSRCNRLKLLGGGWVSEAGKWYCPSCWEEVVIARRRAEIARRKVEGKREAEEERKRAQILSQREEMHQQLELYSSGKIPLPPEFKAPSIALAEFGLKHVDVEWVKRERRLGILERELEDLERVVRPILSVLNEIKSKEATANINDLIELCLQLTEHTFRHSEYLGDIVFPLDVLIHLGEIDRTTTLQRLRKAVCDPNAAGRGVAIIALGKIGDQQAVEPLIGVLKESKGYHHGTAACALVDLGDERAIIPIIRAIREHIYGGEYPSHTARDYIAERLSTLVRPGTDLHRDVFTEWRKLKEVTNPSRRRAVASVIEPVLVDCGGHEAVEVATKWAQSKDNKETIRGTEALAKLDCEEALDALCSIVATPRQIIVEYSDHGDAWNIPDWAPNTEQRIVAAKALAQRGGPKAMAALQNAASDEDAEVKKVIRELLSNI